METDKILLYVGLGISVLALLFGLSSESGGDSYTNTTINNYYLNGSGNGTGSNYTAGLWITILLNEIAVNDTALNLTYVNTNEYPNLDTDKTNDLTTADNTTLVHIGSADLITLDCKNITGGGNVCSDSVGYNSLGDLQSAVSNDFHNLGGVDATGITNPFTEDIDAGGIWSITDLYYITIYDTDTVYTEHYGGRSEYFDNTNIPNKYATIGVNGIYVTPYLSIDTTQFKYNGSEVCTIANGYCNGGGGNSTAEIQAAEADAIAIGKLSTYRNYTDNTGLPEYNNISLSLIQDTNTTVYTNLNLKATITSVQSLLSTYLNLTMFQASNNSHDTRLDNLEGAGYITDGNTNWDNSYNFITNATMNKTVRCLDIVGSPDADFCTDATSAGGVSNPFNQSLNTTDNVIFNIVNASAIINRQLTAASCDVKAYTNGSLYCGTDATGAASGSAPNYNFVVLQQATRSFKGLVTTNLTGLNFTLYAGNLYKYSFTILFTSNDTTNGGRFGVWYPTANIARAKAYIPITTTDGTDAEVIGFITTSGDNVTGTAVTAVADINQATIEGVINATATGKLQVLYGNELATCNLTIRENSYGELWNITGTNTFLGK